ncbi:MULTISPECIES: hypothetical protein [unclassified Yoonia]|uniref:hypothetical protein n=1 Tax=unclassified Yoonia TaxID=2629118 RepID=UPI002AFDD7FF|nr:MULTISPECIES: hypothetical protein [unclassified Yoonia]
MKVATYLVVFVGGVVFCYLMLSIGVVDVVDGIPGAQQEPALSLPTYLSFISAMMTAVTVVLAAVAIGIGVVAAFTVKEIRERADETVKTAKEQADAAKADALALVEAALSEDAINARLLAFQRPTVAELEESFDLDDTGNR